MSHFYDTVCFKFEILLTVHEIIGKRKYRFDKYITWFTSKSCIDQNQYVL